MSLMTSGVGSLVGYLGSGWWFNAVLVYFRVAYHGPGASTDREIR